MILDLLRDFADALDAMPERHPQRRTLALLDEALRRDAHFIDRHPTTLFQCLWNACWWCDSPDALRHYEESDATPDPRGDAGGALSTLLGRWKLRKEEQTPGFTWLQSLRPPPVPVGIGIVGTLSGHNSRVGSIAVSRTGPNPLMVSGSDESVHIWDPASGTLVAMFTENSGNVHKVDLAANGAWAAATGDNWIRIYDVRGAHQRHRLRANAFQVNDVSFSPDARRLASAANDACVRTWDVEQGREIARFTGHKGHVLCVDFSPDGQMIVSGGEDACVRVRNAFDGREMACFRTPAQVECAAFFPCSTQVVAASADGCLCVWSIETGRELLRHQLEKPVRSLDVSPDGTRLVTGSDDGVVKLWDASSGALLAEHQTQGESAPRVSFVPAMRGACVAFAAGGGYRAAVSFEISLWNPAEATRPRRLKGAAESSRSQGLRFSSDGRCLLSCPARGAVDVWDVGDVCEWRRRITTGSIGAADFVPDGTIAAAAPEPIGGIVLWDAQTGRPVRHIPGSIAPDLALAVSEDGRFIATAAMFGPISVWDVAAAREAARFRGNRDLPAAISWSPDASRFAVGTANAVGVWERDSGALVIWLAEYIGSNSDLSFSRDARYLAVGGDEGHVFVWDLVCRRLALFLPGVWDTSAAVGRGNRRILAAVTPLETTILDYQTGTPLGWIPANLASVRIHPVDDVVVGVLYSDLQAYRWHGNAPATGRCDAPAAANAVTPEAVLPAAVPWVDVESELEKWRSSTPGRSYTSRDAAERHARTMTYFGVPDEAQSGPGTDVGEYLESARMFLQQGHPDLAAELLADVADDSRRLLRNALAVCALRMREPHRAAELLRPLVLDADGAALRPGVPTAFAVNCAIALRLSGDARSAEAIREQFDAFTAMMYHDAWDACVQSGAPDAHLQYDDLAAAPGILVLDALKREPLEHPPGRTA